MEMNIIKLSSKAPVIIVDRSYYVFYRYFATARWWSFQNPETGKALLKLTEQSAFEDAFTKHVYADIEKLQKRWGLVGKRKKPIAPNNIIFCRDCPRQEIWRMELYKDYKGTRPVNEKFDTYSFTSFSNARSSADIGISVGYPKLEADDVACLIFRQVRDVMGPEQPVIFITGDHDYLQLKDDYCEIYSLPDKNLWEAGVKKGTDNLHRKIVMGDSSDNIPQVLTKSQRELFMAMDDGEQKAYLDKLGKTKAFELNKILMCWSCIPEDIVKSFNETYQIEKE